MSSAVQTCLRRTALQVNIRVDFQSRDEPPEQSLIRETAVRGDRMTDTGQCRGQECGPVPRGKPSNVPEKGTTPPEASVSCSVNVGIDLIFWPRSFPALQFIISIPGLSNYPKSRKSKRP